MAAASCHNCAEKKGAPREWLCAWYNPSGGPKAKAEFAHDAQFKLYADGRFYNIAKDDQETQLLKDDALDETAKAAKTKLASAIASFAGARPDAIAKQGEAFGGGGEAKGKGRRKKK
jgi:hypothetical protein